MGWEKKRGGWDEEKRKTMAPWDHQQGPLSPRHFPLPRHPVSPRRDTSQSRNLKLVNYLPIVVSQPPTFAVQRGIAAIRARQSRILPFRNIGIYFRNWLWIRIRNIASRSESRCIWLIESSHDVFVEIYCFASELTYWEQVHHFQWLLICFFSRYARSWSKLLTSNEKMLVRPLLRPNLCLYSLNECWFITLFLTLSSPTNQWKSCAVFTYVCTNFFSLNLLVSNLNPARYVSTLRNATRIWSDEKSSSTVYS